MTGRADYYDRQDRRRERLEARAERLSREATARSKRGWDALHAIPFGQPILVGHHSESRDRNYRRKAVGNIDKAAELQKAAGEAAATAANIGTNGAISSDNPDAPDLLREKLDTLKAKQAMMIAANKVIRAFWKHGNRADQPDEELAAYFARMAEAGIGSRTVARQLLAPDFVGRTGFASYQTTNNNANIRKIKQRIAHLARIETRQPREETIGTVRMVENVEENRVQLFFPGKPSADVRQRLKGAGFRWSPEAGAWQRMLGNNAVWAAESIAKEFAGEPSC